MNRSLNGKPVKIKEKDYCFFFQNPANRRVYFTFSLFYREEFYNKRFNSERHKNTDAIESYYQKGWFPCEFKGNKRCKKLLFNLTDNN